MLRALALAGSLALSPLAMGSGAAAAPALRGAGPPVQALIAPAALGCGRGWTRGPYGGCRPIVYDLDVVEHRCFWRGTPFGPRRVCRW